MTMTNLTRTLFAFVLLACSNPKVQLPDVLTAAREICAMNARASSLVADLADQRGQDIEQIVNELCYVTVGDAGQ